MTIRVFILSTGLGRFQRGFESFSSECYEALKDSAGFDFWLFKSGGVSSGHVRKLHCLSRFSKLSALIGKLIGRTSYFVEQLTFFFALLPWLIKLRPGVILFSDGSLGNF